MDFKALRLELLAKRCSPGKVDYVLGLFRAIFGLFRLGFYKHFWNITISADTEHHIPRD